MRIGWIGMGNMGQAMLTAVARTQGADRLCFYEPNRERAVQISEACGVAACESAAEVPGRSKLIVLAVKPQQYEAAIASIRSFIQDSHIIVSIAPGHSIQEVSNLLGGHARVVRAMPNTPALIGRGMTGISYDRTVLTTTEEEELRAFFEAFSMVEVVTEEQLAAVTCISGSSPAYVDIFIETLSDIGVRYGLPRDQAYRFAAQAVAGSACMVLESGEPPAVLKDRVCSPGGTTIAAVEALEAAGFRHSVWEAGRACYKKIQEMNGGTKHE